MRTLKGYQSTFPEGGLEGGAEVESYWMLCAEHNSLLQRHQATIQDLRVSVRNLAVLVDTSATDLDFTLAQWQIRAASGACEIARAAVEHHQAEHGC